MNVQETVRVALVAIVANKLRSLLTMLGVVIGIAAVIAMVALGEGAQKSVQERLQGLGTNVLTVRPARGVFGGVDRGSAALTVEDAEALAEDAGDVAAVAPEMESRLQVVSGGANANLSVVGTWTSYFGVNRHTVAAGRTFTDHEDRARRRVAVVGSLVGERLGTTSQALVGQTVRVGGVPFQVIGVLAEKGAQGFSSPDEAVYVPLGTAEVRVMGSDRLRSIAVQATGEDRLDAVMAEIDRVLRRSHRLRPGTEADFSVQDQTTLLSTVQETARTFTILLAGIAGISLLVGGIGIMNIMLVSVTERTREIGLRKSLGARRRDILLQFLVEALVLCLGGGMLGLALGVGASYAMERAAGMSMSISPESVVLALVFSAAVGVGFGLWPARRAASLAPIEALRYE